MSQPKTQTQMSQDEVGEKLREMAEMVLEEDEQAYKDATSDLLKLIDAKFPEAKGAAVGARDVMKAQVKTALSCAYDAEDPDAVLLHADLIMMNCGSPTINVNGFPIAKPDYEAICETISEPV